jgi:NitT/TauT family transport system substrate-binding protein
LQGETDATLNFWNFCAALEAKGMRQAIPMQRVVKGLDAAGEVAMVGYVFDGGWAEHNRALLDRFLAVMRKAESILADTPAEWERLAPRIGVTEPDALEIYRRRFREGIPKRPLADEFADARHLHRVLASIGGADLVGPSSDLDPGAFYTPGSGE